MTCTPSDPKRNIPRVIGNSYCSPGCGCECTKMAHDKAVKEADALIRLLGAGWQARVWENCGWNYEATNGIAEIYPCLDGSRIDGRWKVTGYTCFLRGHCNTHADAETAEDALGFAIQDARSAIRRGDQELNALSTEL